MLHPGEMGIKGDEIRRTGFRGCRDLGRRSARASRIGEPGREHRRHEDAEDQPSLRETALPFCGSRQRQQALEGFYRHCVRPQTCTDQAICDHVLDFWRRFRREWFTRVCTGLQCHGQRCFGFDANDHQTRSG